MTNVELERRLRSAAVRYERLAPANPDMEQRILARIALTPRGERRIVRRRTVSRGAVRPLRLVAVLAAALALLLFANLGAAYFAPKYGRALASAPLVGAMSGRFLKNFGLTEANATALNDTSVSNGHTLRLVAGYADGLRTVLFLEVDGKGLTGDPKQYGRRAGEWAAGPEGVTLTDQFGHSYQGSGVGSATEVIFEPLTWPASVVGARLTLHLETLTGFWSRPPVEAHGGWTLHATLEQEPVHNLPLPSSIRTANAVYTFTSIRATSTYMEIRWTVSGPASDEVNRTIDRTGLTGPGTPAGAADFFPRLFDEQGHLMQITNWGFEFPKNEPVKGQWNGFIHGSGRYRIQLGDALTSPADQRWIVVP